MARQSPPPAQGDEPPSDWPLSVTDLVVLVVLGEAPAHGFAVARQLAPGTDLGRILTARRSQVYRSIERLVAAGLIEPQGTEPGDAGPRRMVFAVTGAGRDAAERWLTEPVEHIRDMRVVFLVKLRILERRGADPGPLVLAQRRALAKRLDRLIDAGTGTGDVVDRWRASNAAAAQRFLAGWSSD